MGAEIGLQCARYPGEVGGDLGGAGAALTPAGHPVQNPHAWPAGGVVVGVGGGAVSGQWQRSYTGSCRELREMFREAWCILS